MRLPTCLFGNILTAILIEFNVSNLLSKMIPHTPYDLGQLLPLRKLIESRLR